MHLNRTLIQWHTPDGASGSATQPPRVDRVVWVSDGGDLLATIDVFARRAWPRVRRSDDVLSALSCGEAHLLTIDPYDGVIPTGEGITDAARRYRDRALTSIAPLIDDRTGAMFDPVTRGTMIRDAKEASGRARMSIEKDVQRWWQRGMVHNALLPDHHRCGGEQKPHAAGEKKRGTKSTHIPKKDTKACAIAKNTSDGRAHTGINIDEKTRRLMMMGITEFYERAARQAPKGKKPTFLHACTRTREKYFNVGYEVQNGTPVPTLPPAHLLPTDDQFRYWYRKEKTPAASYEARHTEREINLQGREVMGDTSEMRAFPGAQWQIDATKADIWLVSDIDPTIVIGSPTVYGLKDPFGRLIAGMNVTIGDPSWTGAMETMYNGACDKVAYCRSYGITITEEDWPTHHLPYEYLADGGELKGYNSDQPVEGLHVDINNTGSYRGDLKGVVERDFHQANDELIRNLPGAKPSLIARGDVDPAKHACLTVREFTRLMVQRVLTYNKIHRLETYPMTREMRADGVKPYPLDIWRWGIAALGGPPEVTAESIDRVRLNLLPTVWGMITDEGIAVDGLLYDSEYGSKQGWFAAQREPHARRIPVRIAIEPRLVDVVYLRLDKGRVASPCMLRERHHAYLGSSWIDVQADRRGRGIERATGLTDVYQEQAKLHALTSTIEKEAEKRKARARRDKIETGQKVKNVGRKAARQDQRRREDHERAWRLASHPASASTDPLPFRQGRTPTLPPASSLEADQGHRDVQPIIDHDKYRRLRDAARTAALAQSTTGEGEDNDD